MPIPWRQSATGLNRSSKQQSQNLQFFSLDVPNMNLGEQLLERKVARRGRCMGDKSVHNWRAAASRRLLEEYGEA